MSAPRSVARNALLAMVALFLLVLAWGALSGGVRQIPLARTFGRQAQTALQLATGVLSVLVLITHAGRHAERTHVRAAWAASLTLAAGLSSLVWGPPMPLLAVVFAAVALLLALGVIRVLRTTFGD